MLRNFLNILLTDLSAATVDNRESENNAPCAAGISDVGVGRPYGTGPCNEEGCQPFRERCPLQYGQGRSPTLVTTYIDSPLACAGLRRTRWRRRVPMKPIRAMPAIIIIHCSGSGIAATFKVNDPE